MIQSYRASEPLADKLKQEEDLPIPHSSGEISHGGENKKAGEEITSLSTLIERLEKGLGLKTYTLTLLFSESAPHDGLWRIELFWITKKQSDVHSDISCREV